MKFRVENVVEDESSVEIYRIVAMEKLCAATDTPICGLGLTIMDGKNLLGTVQSKREFPPTTASGEHRARSLKRELRFLEIERVLSSYQA